MNFPPSHNLTNKGLDVYFVSFSVYEVFLGLHTHTHAHNADTSRTRIECFEFPVE